MFKINEQDVIDYEKYLREKEFKTVNTINHVKTLNIDYNNCLLITIFYDMNSFKHTIHIPEDVCLRSVEDILSYDLPNDFIFRYIPTSPYPYNEDYIVDRIKNTNILKGNKLANIDTINMNLLIKILNIIFKDYVVISLKE